MKINNDITHSLFLTSMLTIPKCDLSSSPSFIVLIVTDWSFCMISTMNPASTTAQNSRSSSWSNHLDSRSFCVATVWVLPNADPLFDESFNFDVKNHQCDLLGEGGDDSGPLKELCRGGIIISGDKTIFFKLCDIIDYYNNEMFSVSMSTRLFLYITFLPLHSHSTNENFSRLLRKNQFL